VVDRVGRPETIELACDIATPGGAIVVLAGGDYGVPTRPIVYKELRIIGARSGHHAKQVMDLLLSGRVRLDGVITHRFPLTEAAAAFACALTPDSIRVALDC
jgi:threonine dehydrogenase-like Zn-dependent dehydrogenase